MPDRDEQLDTELLHELQEALAGKEVVYTLAQSKPNWIIEIDDQSSHRRRSRSRPGRCGCVRIQSRGRRLGDRRPLVIPTALERVHPTAPHAESAKGSRPSY